MKSRRLFARAPAKLKVTYKFVLEGKKTLSSSLKGVTENISAGGLLLTGEIKSLNPDKLLSHDAAIAMEIQIMPQKSIFALGKCAWLTKAKKGYDLGINFTEITERDRDYIQEYVIKYFLTMQYSDRGTDNEQ